MGTDHIPINITVKCGSQAKVTEPDIIAELHRWNWQRADWSKFQEVIIKSIEEARATSTDKEQSIKQTYKVMVDTILRAADKAIPMKGKRPEKPFWNDKCEAAVQERNSAENNKAKTEDSKAKDKEATNTIYDEMLEFWKEKVRHFDMRTKPKEVCGLYKV